MNKNLKKLHLKRQQIRILTQANLTEIAGGLPRQETLACPHPPGGTVPTPTVAYTCMHSCLLCGPF